MNALLKSKTVWASVASLATSAAGVALGDATAWQGVQAGIMALVAIFMRAAIAKAGGTDASASDASASEQ